MPPRSPPRRQPSRTVSGMTAKRPNGSMWQAGFMKGSSEGRDDSTWRIARNVAPQARWFWLSDADFPRAGARVCAFRERNERRCANSASWHSCSSRARAVHPPEDRQPAVRRPAESEPGGLSAPATMRRVLNTLSRRVTSRKPASPPRFDSGTATGPYARRGKRHSACSTSTRTAQG